MGTKGAVHSLSLTQPVTIRKEYNHIEEEDQAVVIEDGTPSAATFRSDRTNGSSLIYRKERGSGTSGFAQKSKRKSVGCYPSNQFQSQQIHHYFSVD